jgi:hypothetical protein
VQDEPRRLGREAHLRRGEVEPGLHERARRDHERATPDRRGDGQVEVAGDDPHDLRVAGQQRAELPPVVLVQREVVHGRDAGGQRRMVHGQDGRGLRLGRELGGEPGQAVGAELALVLAGDGRVEDDQAQRPGRGRVADRVGARPG